MGYFSASDLGLTKSQVNLLAHLTTWVVLRNREHFRFGDGTAAGGADEAVEGEDSAVILV